MRFLIILSALVALGACGSVNQQQAGKLLFKIVILKFLISELLVTV